MRSFDFLPYLKAFNSVAREGSIRRASEELSLSPGAVSQQLKRLSEVTGLQLIKKCGRGVELTEAGRVFAKTVDQSLTDLSQALRQASDGTEDIRSHTMTLSIPFSLGVAWLAGSFVEHAERERWAKLTVRTGLRATDIDWSDTDIAVIYDNPPFKGLWWQRLSEVNLHPVCSPVIFHRVKSSRRERQIRNVTLLHEDDGEEWARWSTASGIGIQDVQHTYFSSVALAQASAVRGHGVALISDVLGWTDIKQGRLIQPLPYEIPASSEYYIVTPAENSDDPRLTSTIDQIMHYLQEQLR